MKIRSCKAKGRSLVKEAAELIRGRYSLPESDVRVPPTSCPGADLWLSHHAISVFPFAVECKNVEKLNVYKAYKQALSNSGTLTPLLIHSKNHEDIYVTLKLKDFLWSLK